MTQSSYGPMQKALHWLVFLLVIFLYGITYGEDFFPRGDPGRDWIWWLHISFGLVLAGALIPRILTRLTMGTPGPAPSVTPLQQRLAGIVHFALYALLVGVVTIGIALAFYRGNAVSFFGLFTIPSPIAPHKDTAHTIQELHELGATLLVALAGFHAVAALYHHFIRRDAVLERMLPGGNAG